MGAGETKLAVEKSVQKLLEEVVPQDQYEFWAQLWTVPTSSADVFSLFKLQDVRLIKQQKPQNLAILINKVVDILLEAVSLEARNKNYADGYKSVLNAARIITRLMPLLFEDQADLFVERVFWRNESPLPPNSHPSAPSEELKEGSSKTSKDAEEIVEDRPQDANAEPLAIRLIQSLVSLLFIPNFTISAPAQTASRGFLLPLNHLWATGIGVSEVMASTAAMMSNRAEILKALLSCLSSSLYTPPEYLGSNSNRWLEYMVNTNSYYSLGLFYSLLNISCNYDPIGWGLPYNHLMFTDTQEELADISLQILVILIDYNPTPNYLSTAISTKVSREILEAQDKKTQSQDLKCSNVFVSYLRDIRKKEDFKFLFNALERLLNNPIRASSTYLPNSKKSIECHQEILMMFWKLIHENKGFLNFLFTQEDLMKIVSPILHFIYEGRKDPAQLGLIHLSTFILLLLSGERDFGVALNRVYPTRPSLDLPPFNGSYADFLLLIFQKLFVDGSERLEPLYECLLTIITNISPYIKSLAMVTSITLLKLFDYVSRPKFVFANERNHRYVFFLLEILNNIIQYQYEGNSRLIYSILRNSNSFNKLFNLKISDLKQRQPKEVQSTEESPKEPEVEPKDTPSSNQFVPTEEWLNTWKPQLPLATTLQLIEVVSPQIAGLITGSATDEANILVYLQTTTLVGLIPVPHPILIRKYQQNEATDIWLTTFIWGVIYKRNQEPPIFYGTHVRAFVINVQTL